ncbi:MAG TPA: beta-ketoacyl synthase chain length factor [Lautropia sp.]|jgi:hypothetical protein|nr:beta-ketoacyl synthase chain length factor [Lautropia sp.]
MTGGDLCARICGIGLVAPGINDWDEGRLILSGQQPWQHRPLAIPANEFLPAAERRRAGKAIRLALGCGHQAIVNSGRPAENMASIFASADVDAENTHQICLALKEAEPSLSPTRFHNSVQNAVSGYWTILTGSRAATTMVMGGDEILALGLLEAMSQAATTNAPVLLVVFDVPMPAPLFATHPVDGGGAVALVIEAGPGEGPTIRVRLLRRNGDAGVEGIGAHPKGAGRLMPDGLESLRGVHPLGAALPLLVQMAAPARPRRAEVVSGSCRSKAGAFDESGTSLLKFDRYHALQVTID